MFTDEIGNKMGFYGEIAEITKVEIYEYEFKEIELFWLNYYPQATLFSVAF